MVNPKLSVVIPVYNEGRRTLREGVLEGVANYLKKQNYHYEVVVVDDGSTDNSVKVIKEQIRDKKNFSLIQNSHKGKAFTVMTGLLQSKGEVAVFTDLDQSTPLKELEKFLPKFEQGFDIVIGTRSGRVGSPIIRKIASWTFSLLRNLILGLPISDTQCGFKAFNRRSISLIFPTLLERRKDGFVQGRAVNAGFDVEALFIAKEKNLKIAEVAVEWHHVGTEKERLIRDAIEAIKDMFRIKINSLMGEYT